MQASQYITRFAVLAALSFMAAAAASGAFEMVRVANWRGKRRLLLYSVSAACAMAAVGIALPWLRAVRGTAHPVFRAALSAPALWAAFASHNRWTEAAAMRLDGSGVSGHYAPADALMCLCAAMFSAAAALVWLPSVSGSAWAVVLSWRTAAVMGLSLISAVLLSFGAFLTFSFLASAPGAAVCFALGAASAVAAVLVADITGHAGLRIAIAAVPLLLSALDSYHFQCSRYDTEPEKPPALTLAEMLLLSAACGMVLRMPVPWA